MTNLDKELHKLSQIKPSKKFCRDAKERLMHQIILHKNETWLIKLLKKVPGVTPPKHFMQMARMRLLERISAAKQPFVNWLTILKRITASTLVMVLAVTATLFFAGEKQPVSASDTTYLEITSGEVKIKHSDKLIWDVINKQTELSAGDLIKMDNEASAVIHFFDDSQLRLSGNSSLLLNRLNISPGFEKQGVIEVVLNQGKAWVQTLNVDDDFAKFTISTPNAIISAINSSFDVETDLFKPTSIRVFKNNVNVKVSNKDREAIFAEGNVNVLQKTSLSTLQRYSKDILKLSRLTNILDLTKDDQNETWVKNNLKSDDIHLAKLREREFINLEGSTGLLPGQVLYPLKRAKERLMLAFSNNESQSNLKISIANQRLNESVILLKRGDVKKAKEALVEYQNLVNEIAKENKNKLSNRVVVKHQKTLVSALPGDTIVKDVLNETEEFLEEDPFKKVELKLKNSLDNLINVQSYVSAGDVNKAQEKLKEHNILVASAFVENGIKFKDNKQKKKFYDNLLEAQSAEKRILKEINTKLEDKSADHRLVLLIKSKGKDMDKSINKTNLVAYPLAPKPKPAKSPEDEKIDEFVKRINIYKSFSGQKNQVHRLLKENPKYANDVEFLSKLNSKLDLRTKNLINIKILEVSREQEKLKWKMGY